MKRCDGKCQNICLCLVSDTACWKRHMWDVLTFRRNTIFLVSYNYGIFNNWMSIVRLSCWSDQVSLLWKVLLKCHFKENNAKWLKECDSSSFLQQVALISWLNQLSWHLVSPLFECIKRLSSSMINDETYKMRIQILAINLL